MKLTAPASVVSCILLAISWQLSTVTSVVTSYEKLHKLVDGGDGILIRGIEDTVTQEQERITNLTNILVQHFKTTNEDYQFQADHPNDFYLLVKHHVFSWYGGVIDEELFPALEKVIQNRKITFPQMDDYGDATLALVRLQYVYKLKAQDMFEGNYLGYMGPSLDTEDAYLVGKQAFEAGHLPEAKEWLQMSADMLKKDMENEQQNPSEDGGESFEILLDEYQWTLALLGRVYFYMNDTETARTLYEQCISGALTDNEEAEELRKGLEADNITKLQENFGENVKDVDDNITALCSREKHHRIPDLRPYHVCRYKSDPFIPYRLFKEEILSTSPYVSLFYDVISNEEIEKLKDLTIEHGLSRAQVVGSHISDVRTGDLGWLPDSEDPLVARVSQRVKAFTRLDVTFREGERSSSEKMQVVNYGLGGHYDIHMDALSVNDPRQRHRQSIQNRLATVLFYLSDVEKGGATIFPIVGISVSPVKGMALLWYSYQPHMKGRDMDTRHAGCPVVMGNKWIANKWIWTYGNTFRRPCGLTPQSQQLEVENIPSLNALKEVIE